MSWTFFRECSRSRARVFTIVVLMLALLAGAEDAFAVKPFLSGEIFEMVVETDVCLRQPAAGGCSDLVSTEAAAPGNPNPIRITLSLIQPNGAGVTGLVRGDFDFEWRFGQPIEIPAVGICASCFEDTSLLFSPIPGMYVLFITPLANWEDVNISRLRVDVSPTLSLYKLIKLDLR